MSWPPPGVFAKLVTTFALLGYVVAVGEQFVPDDHDWHAARNASIEAQAQVPQGPTAPAPTHPVHLCHSGHEHTLAQPGLAAGLSSFVMGVSAADFPEPDAPSSLSPPSLLRPPIA